MRLGRAWRTGFRSKQRAAQSKAAGEGFGLIGPDRLLRFLRTRPCFRPYRPGLGGPPLVWLKRSRPLIVHQHRHQSTTHQHHHQSTHQRGRTRLQLAMQILVNQRWYRFRHAMTVITDQASPGSALAPQRRTALPPAYYTMPILARIRTLLLPTAEAPRPVPATEDPAQSPTLPTPDLTFRPHNVNRRELPAEAGADDGAVPLAHSPVGPRAVTAGQPVRIQTLAELLDELNSSQMSRITDGILREIDERIIVARERRNGA